MRDKQTQGQPPTKPDEGAEKTNVPMDSSGETQDMNLSAVKLPIFLRWPLILILLFIVPPYGTIAGLILAVMRLVFSHKHPEYKLKMRTKVIIGVLCAAFVAWSMTLESSEPSVSVESPSSIQSAQDNVPPADTQPAPASEAASVSDNAQAERQPKSVKRPTKRSKRRLKKRKLKKLQKRLRKSKKHGAFPTIRTCYKALLQITIRTSCKDICPFTGRHTRIQTRWTRYLLRGMKYMPIILLSMNWMQST